MSNTSEQDQARYAELAGSINTALDGFKHDGISHDPKKGLDKVLAYQDLIGRAQICDLQKYEANIDREQRRTFYWANFQTLDHDTAMQFIQWAAARMAGDAIDSVEDRRQKEFDNLERMYDQQARAYEELSTNNAQLRRSIAEDADKADYEEQWRAAVCEIIKLKIKHAEPLSPFEQDYVSIHLS